MILKKLIISLSFLLIFNGCAQNAAFLGPAITGASTGSIYNASLSYGSGKVIKKATGKTPFLLLDDIFEKIDEERASVLTQIVKNDNFGQIFITDTNEDRLNTFCEEIGKPYKTITIS